MPEIYGLTRDNIVAVYAEFERRSDPDKQYSDEEWDSFTAEEQAEKRADYFLRVAKELGHFG